MTEIVKHLNAEFVNERTEEGIDTQELALGHAGPVGIKLQPSNAKWPVRLYGLYTTNGEDTIPWSSNLSADEAKTLISLLQAAIAEVK